MPKTATALQVGNLLVVLALCSATELRGQDANHPPFEVASIRINTSDGPQRLSLFPQFTAQNVTLKGLFLLAYDVKDHQVSGWPGWANLDHYDITTRIADAPAPSREAMRQLRGRLQSLLQERFKLAVHHETRELPIYELTVSKGGAKLKASTCVASDPKNPGLAPGKTMMDYCYTSGVSKGRFEASSTTTGDLAKALSNLLDRTVIDKTDIGGMFHVVLTFAIDDSNATTPDTPVALDTRLPQGDAPPNIFTALQEQLGLRLGSSKGPVDVMVIDHLEKPSDN